MGMSKTEINLRRLLSVAPNQQNQSKLIHYVATLRELLEQLSQEKTTPPCLPRKLQEDLADEMVGLARQLKETNQAISQSVQNTEKILDSTEEAIEQSLASTGHATTRATKIYSQSSKTSCFQWLLIFAMTC
ncbi:PREDICTED: uncharacterized protein LOC109126479 [Camelina sativa]|uniref:Uncharacterized protein LOC109126479 n=1 Tax=Camelina sativa TaxID=90675 RepID=A0ABM1QFQ8_CAMSA|nr:PREDICTED: uncharacterized protein LOC109126479 [Camelina sativa]